MKSLFKSKPKTPAEQVRIARELLLSLDRNDIPRSKKEEKMTELSKVIVELKWVLYGKEQSEPVAEACAQLTKEFFRENTMRLLIISIPKLNLETRKDATQIVANLQRQRVHSRLIACDYLEANKDLMDILLSGYENMDIALHYGPMLRDCTRHQSIARYVLDSEHMKKFFEYIEIPNFDIASDVVATFKELLTRHKSTVAEFLSKNYDWFFAEYSKLLSSPNYMPRRQAIKEDNKNIPLDTFHVFKLFVANEKKPHEITSILLANRDKLFRLFDGLKIDKEDEDFDADKMEVIRQIAALQA